MKPYAARIVPILCGLALASAASASDMLSASLNRFPSKVLPVLVRVDAHGTVTDISPAAQLSPAMDRMLRESVVHMIARPAHYKGRPISSQCVLNLALEARPRGDGRYDARFVYRSVVPVPSGSWYWVHVDGRRLALASRDRVMPWPEPYRRHHRMPRPFVPPAARQLPRTPPQPAARDPHTHR